MIGVIINIAFSRLLLASFCCILFCLALPRCCKEVDANEDFLGLDFIAPSLVSSLSLLQSMRWCSFELFDGDFSAVEGVGFIAADNEDGFVAAVDDDLLLPSAV